MFEIKANPQLNKDSFIFSERGEYPYFTRTVFNNGFLGNVEYLDEKHKIQGNCLAVGMIGMQFFYMEKDFYAGQFTKRAIPLGFNLNSKNAMYLISLINKFREKFQNVLVKDFEKTFYSQKIMLPTKDNKIDFDFMEIFIAELEAEHLSELETYLLTTGLKDYKLNSEEEKILKNFHTIKWDEFRIGDLLDKVKVNKLPFKASELPKEMVDTYTLPCLTSSFRNQGLNYYVQKENVTILKNVISIPANSDVYRAYFQSREFTVLSDSYAIDWKVNNKERTAKQYLCMVSCINKVTDLPIYSYKNKLGGWNVVKNKNIQLPSINNTPDYNTMETLISAIQKLVIKDVVLYSDSKKSRIK